MEKMTIITNALFPLLAFLLEGQEIPMDDILFICLYLGQGIVMLVWPKKIQSTFIKDYENNKMFRWWFERRTYVLELRTAGLIIILSGLFVLLVN